MHRRTNGGALGLVPLLLFCSAAAGALQQQNPAVVNGLPETIPLRLLLGNAKYRNPQLDSYGKYVSFIKPDSNGIMNIFVQQLPTGPQLASMDRTVGLLEQRAPTERQVTFDEKRGVSSYSWAEDDSTIFFLQDVGGDENYHLYSVPVSSIFKQGSSSSAAKDLTPWPQVKVQGIITSPRVPRKIYFSMNKRNPEVFDLYMYDMDNGDIYLHSVNPGDVSSWLVDFDFNLRGVENYNSSDGSTYIMINDDLPAVSSSSSSSSKIQEEKGANPNSSSSTSNRSPAPYGSTKGKPKLPGLFETAKSEKWSEKQWIAASTTGSDLNKWRLLLHWPFGSEDGVYRFNRDGTGLYGTANPGDTTDLVLYSTAPGAKILKELAANDHANVGGVVFNPIDWEPQMVSFNYLRPQWVFLDDSLKDMWRKLEAFQPNRDPNIISRADDSSVFIISYNADNHTTAMYLYKPGTWPPQLLLEMQPGLNKYKLAPMHSIVITARDGLKLPAYLTMPLKTGVPAVLPQCVIGDVPDLSPAAAKAIAASPLKCPLNLKLPLILFVHGGPWARDTWGADSVVQWLTNRGYAVLQVNYRGSTGFGEKMANAGNREWGTGKMQHDLTDSVRWAIEKGIADPKKVCIFGASYGGYATLAGLTFTPELYACGVDVVGISNVATFLKEIPAYWKPIRIDFEYRVGDAETNETLNREISPMFHIDKIRAPLLIGQGANDPRVPKRESDQMFSAMKKKGLDVEYILYTDEGHGLVRPDNRLDFYSRMEQFLQKHLGGRAEPLYTPPKSSAKVITDV